MLGLFPAGGAPIAGLLIEEPEGPVVFDPASLLGFLTVGAREMPILAPLDLLALDGDTVTDAVMLVELTATDGAISIAVQTSVGGHDLGLVPAGIDPFVLGLYPLALAPVVASGGTVAMRWSDRDWTSLPDDTLPDTHFEGRVESIAFDRALPILPGDDRRLAGAKVEILIHNADGAYDGIEQRLAVDGRRLTISLLGHRSHAYADRRVILDGRARGWLADAKRLRITAGSLAAALDVPLLALYGGTGGLDGGDLLKGQVRQRILGLCRGAPVQVLDEGLQLYLLTDGPAQEILAVYVRGHLITAGTEHLTFADLADAAEDGDVLAGTYDWCATADGTAIAIGGSVDGTVTCDIRGDAAGGYVETHGAMMRKLLLLGGADISSAAFASVTAMLPGAAGIVFAEQLTFAEAVSRIAASAVLWWGDTGTGVISVGRLAAPNGSGGVLLSDDNLRGEVEVLESPRVLWRVTAEYRRNWTPLAEADIAAGLPEGRRAELTQASYRTAVVAVPDRRARNADAGEVTISTLYDAEVDADSVCSNMLSLHAPGRGRWAAPAGISGLGLPLAQRGGLSWPRYGLAGGRGVRVVGQELRDRAVRLTVLG